MNKLLLIFLLLISQSCFSRTLESEIGRDYWFRLGSNRCIEIISKSSDVKPFQNRYLTGYVTHGTITRILMDTNPTKDKLESYKELVEVKFDNNTVGYIPVIELMIDFDTLDEGLKDSNKYRNLCVTDKEPTALEKELQKSNDQYLKKIHDELEKKNNEEELAKRKQENKELKEEKRRLLEKKIKSHKQGVSIGMTPKEVIEKTSWGKPKSVNRTTNQYGVSEQWVYGDGNYLYFDNGKLTSIQN